MLITGSDFYLHLIIIIHTSTPPSTSTPPPFSTPSPSPSWPSPSCHRKHDCFSAKLSLPPLPLPSLLLSLCPYHAPASHAICPHQPPPQLNFPFSSVEGLSLWPGLLDCLSYSPLFGICNIGSYSHVLGLANDQPIEASCRTLNYVGRSPVERCTAGRSEACAHATSK